MGHHRPAGLRAAAFRTFRRLLIVDQTLEPSQIAGFNQFTDEFNQTSSWVKGVGLDAVLAEGSLWLRLWRCRIY